MYTGLTGLHAVLQHIPNRVQRRIDADDVARARQRLGQRRRLLDGAADDRRDDLGELRRVRGREQNPHPPIVPARTVQPFLPLQTEIRDRAVRIEQVPTRLVHAPNHPAHLLVAEAATDDVAAHVVDVVVIQPAHPLEVARMPDVHRVRDRRHRCARFVAAGFEVRGHDVVRIRRGDEVRHRQPRPLGEQPGREIPEVAARRREHNLATPTRVTRLTCRIRLAGLTYREEVVDRLRQQPPDVHRVRGCQLDARAQIGVRERFARQPVAVVEAAGDRVGADIRPFAVEHRQLRFLGRTHPAVRIQDDDTGVGSAMKRVADGAAGIAGGRHQDRERIVATVQRRHQPRHCSRADVLEGERRPVEQLERVDAGLDLDERNREIQRFDDDGLERRGIDRAARERAQRAQADLGQRTSRQPRQLALGPRLDCFRHVEAAVRCDAVVQRGRERDRRAVPRGQEPHASDVTMWAPCGAIGDTYVCGGAPPMCVRTAAVIARATRSASAVLRQSANSEGPDPDRLQPSAPASTAACLIAASPGTSDARRGSAIVSSSERDSRSKSLRWSASTKAPRFAHWRIASPSGTWVPSSARAFAVSISRSGWTTTAVRPAGPGRRTTSGGFGTRTSTTPPYTAGAMLSPWAEPAPIRSPSKAHAITVSSEARAPTSALTATTAATALAALPPRPLDSGSPLWIVRVTPRRSPTASSSACAATLAVFRDASRGSRPPSPPNSPIVTPPPRAKAAVTMSPGSCSANPSTSKPQATFETVAGAKALTRVPFTGDTAAGSLGSGSRGSRARNRSAARSPSRCAPRRRRRRPATNRRCPGASRRS